MIGRKDDLILERFTKPLNSNAAKHRAEHVMYEGLYAGTLYPAFAIIYLRDGLIVCPDRYVGAVAALITVSIWEI